MERGPSALCKPLLLRDIEEMQRVVFAATGRLPTVAVFRGSTVLFHRPDLADRINPKKIYRISGGKITEMEE
jgi:hypothetical protein